MHRRRSVLAVLLTAGLLGGCTGSPDTSGPLPAGPELVNAVAETLLSLRSVHFTLGVSGGIDGLPIPQMDGDATLDGGKFGSAQGHADVQPGDTRVKLQYVLRGDEVTTTDTNGMLATLPVSEGYNPRAMLGPGGSLRRLVAGATGLRTEGRERVQGVEAYRVGGTVPAAVISGVAAGIRSEVVVKIWVSQAEPRQVMRLWIQVPPTKDHVAAVMLELALTRQNVPVSAD
ncbi:LppX_LprAFG lipoprotein [Amycolatopsis sp. H20-H5]|uniref:LppX_LprAFG lipoprotein n=1 Tax=Amycolatopsis sp. H20-H5 TaxID=3046309 RepID=UPI002DB63F40|nr:LppX_LprAFG lipoprotein [Amycolatopsis sp. H20-H5]MEC3980621.1 LppX_LprAFG lipoprotein [Amycolatopsis sp. H20-H5]